ncbi:MAG: molybdate ABC transporter substrate-binding protein, partial [Verrucomicrobiota bacterium]
TRRTLLANTLVLIVNREHPAPIVTAADLANAAVRRVAIGAPRTVPAGTYAKAWLDANDLWDHVAPKTIPLDNVRSVLAAVAAGNANAGIVYATDAATSDKVTNMVTLSPDAAFEITYPAAVVKASTQPAEAKALLAFLAGPEAQAVFARHGFLSPE